jgi:hypothetical protein
MAATPINPAHVDWSGENPGLYLREGEDGPYTCLASFFRVVYSPHGPGHALVLLWDPNAEHPHNGIYTDNDTLGAWLRDNFVAYFGAFKGNPLVATMPLKSLEGVRRGGDAVCEYAENLSAGDHKIKLVWAGLSAPYMVQLPTDRSATGVHEMFSLFLDAREGYVEVDGERARGQAAPRDYHGRKSSTAFLAFSETWVRP